MEQNAKKKISCGGFMLGEGLVLSEDGKTLSVSGGGGSVPKPLTFDYMPEGYPTKSVQTTTLMEEQEVAFTLDEESGVYMAQITNAFEIIEGQTYTVNWDGAEYECVGIVFHSVLALGNLSIYGASNDTGEPFIYTYDSSQPSAGFTTHDTSASHTISVKTAEEVITPMAEEFLPNTLEIDSIIIKSSTTDSTKKFKITVDDSGTLKATEI